MSFLTQNAYVSLTKHRQRSNGAAGVVWVDGLERAIGDMCERWSLTPSPAYANLTYNFVIPVHTVDGQPAVLKLCLPDHDFLCEAEALSVFDGEGCVRLLQVDRERGALLLERVQAGTQVHSLEDDVAETSAVSAVMRKLQRPYAGIFPFPHATEWIDAAFDPNAVPGLKSSYPWFQKALDRLVEIAAEPFDAVLLHGDLHHYNVLSAQRDPWLAIDPKGVIGDPAWEIAPFLLNSLERYPRGDWPDVIRQRADQLAEELELPRVRVYAWSAVRAVQSAFWSLREDERDGGAVHEGAKVCAEVLSTV